MVVLRKARLEDFEIFKILYEDDGNYHFLYNNDNQEKESESVFEYICEEDFLKIGKEYENYTLDRFKKDLKTNCIFVAEKDSKIIGYILIAFTNRRGTYNIEEWAMFNPEDEESKVSMFQELLKQKSPKMRKLLVNVLSNSANMFLREIGFEPIKDFSLTLKYEVEKKKTG